MDLEQMLSEPAATLRLVAADRKQALTEVAGSLAERQPGLDPGRIYESLWGRECLGSTGIGDGLAVPHARMSGVTGIEIVVATCSAGIEFNAVDGKPVRILVGVLSPADAPREGLKALSDVVRWLREPAVRQALDHAADHP